jgi:hypothetical protein
LFPRIKSQAAGHSVPLYVCFYPNSAVQIPSAEGNYRLESQEIPRPVRPTFITTFTDAHVSASSWQDSAVMIVDTKRYFPTADLLFHYAQNAECATHFL